VNEHGQHLITSVGKNHLVVALGVTGHRFLADLDKLAAGVEAALGVSNTPT
jgi:hypothetical protein